MTQTQEPVEALPPSLPPQLSPRQIARARRRQAAARAWREYRRSLEGMIGLGIMLYLLFFLLRDGDELARRTKEAIPLRADQQLPERRVVALVLWCDDAFIALLDSFASDADATSRSASEDDELQHFQSIYRDATYYSTGRDWSDYAPAYRYGREAFEHHRDAGVVLETPHEHRQGRAVPQ